jgi:hypothetical protein
MRDLGKVTHVDGCSYCDLCGHWIDANGACRPDCSPQLKRPSARAAPRKPKVSLDDIERAFARNKGEL